MDDLSVVGLDLSTGRSVHVLDQPRHVWALKGYGTGDGTLVCWHCYYGTDAAVGTRVPLVYRGGKKYGKVRAHFAHPPGQAPPGGLHPETLWHANAKQTIVRWARSQPGVVEVRTEYWTADGRRRSDVEVLLADGVRVVIEVQQQPLTDQAWSRRHHDYITAGLVDVWLWHARLGVPGIARDEPQCHWLIGVDVERIGAPLARVHGFEDGWWERPDLRLRAFHHPPCPGDEVFIRWAALDTFARGPSGLVLPVTVVAELREQAAQAGQLARAAVSGSDHRWCDGLPRPRPHPAAADRGGVSRSAPHRCATDER